MSKTLFCIVGETGSGKDTVARKLNKKLVVSYTTRPKRDNEIDGREHYFITDEEFDRMEKEEHLIAYTKIGNIRYGATLERLNGAEIYVINPDGVKWFKENGIRELKIVTIGLFVPLEERKKRCSWRSDYETSFMKRVEAEKNDFEQFRLNGEFDYMIYNHDLEKTAKIIKKIMEIEKNADFN